jgi:hypothetical protein
MCGHGEGHTLAGVQKLLLLGLSKSRMDVVSGRNTDWGVASQIFPWLIFIKTLEG